MNIICLDCGASFLKGALYLDGHLKKRLQRQSPALVGDCVRETKQIEALLKEVYSLLEELAQGLTQAVLCVSNEMHGFILSDSDGVPLTDYISWQREFGSLHVEGVSAVRLLSESSLAEEILKTGMPLRAGLPSTNLMYLRRQGVLSTHENLYFHTLGDFLLRYLSRQQPYCHLSNAAATGLYDLESGCWNESLVKRVWGSGLILPTVGSKVLYFHLGNTEFAALPAIGDQQASLLGAGLSSLTDLSINLGTGAQVSLLLPENGLHNELLSSERKYQLRPFFDGFYLKTLPHLPSGRALNVYVRFVQSILSDCQAQIPDERLWDFIQSSAEQAVETDLACDLSFFENPLTEMKRGSLTAISEENLNFGTLFRAIFRQMADNFLMAANMIGIQAQQPRRILFSGGVARRIPLLRQYILEGLLENLMVELAEDETMQGLRRYAELAYK